MGTWSRAQLGRARAAVRWIFRASSEVIRGVNALECYRGKASALHAWAEQLKKTCSAAAVPACLVRAARSAQLHGVCGENSKQGEVTASGRPFSGGEHRTS